MASHRKLRSGNEWRNPFRQPECVVKHFEEMERRAGRIQEPMRNTLAYTIRHIISMPPYQEPANE